MLSSMLISYGFPLLWLCTVVYLIYIYIRQSPCIHICTFRCYVRKQCLKTESQNDNIGIEIVHLCQRSIDFHIIVLGQEFSLHYVFLVVAFADTCTPHTHEHTVHHSKRRLYAEPWLYPVFNFPGESIVAFVSLWMRFTCTNIYTSIHFQVKTWMRSLFANVQTFFEIPCRWFPSWTDWPEICMHLFPLPCSTPCNAFAWW